MYLFIYIFSDIFEMIYLYITLYNNIKSIVRIHIIYKYDDLKLLSINVYIFIYIL